MFSLAFLIWHEPNLFYVNLFKDLGDSFNFESDIKPTLEFVFYTLMYISMTVLVFKLDLPDLKQLWLPQQMWTLHWLELTWNRSQVLERILTLNINIKTYFFCFVFLMIIYHETNLRIKDQKAWIKLQK